MSKKINPADPVRLRVREGADELRVASFPSEPAAFAEAERLLFGARSRHQYLWLRLVSIERQVLLLRAEFDPDGDVEMQGESRFCRGCGCSEDDACVSEDGDTCSWMGDDLCSACAGKVAA